MGILTKSFSFGNLCLNSLSFENPMIMTSGKLVPQVGCRNAKAVNISLWQ